MKEVIIKGLAEFAGEVFKEAIAPRLADLKGAAISAVKDTGRGKWTIDEWAAIATKGIDKIKDRAINQDGLRYVGGKLKFAIPNEPQKGLEKIRLSFELYFLDAEENWKKIGSNSEIPASNLTNEALEELKAKGEIIFEVEE